MRLIQRSLLTFLPRRWAAQMQTESQGLAGALRLRLRAIGLGVGRDSSEGGRATATADQVPAVRSDDLAHGFPQIGEPITD